MKTKLSPFLSGVKPVLKDLVTELEKHFDYASVLGTDVSSVTYSVRKSVSGVSDSQWTERGFVARVYKDNRFFEYSFTDISREKLSAVAEAVAGGFARALRTKTDFIKYPAPKEEAATQSFCGEVKLLPEERTAEQILSTLSAITKKGLSLSDKIFEFASILSLCTVNKVFISKKRDLEQSYVWSEGVCAAFAREGNKTKQSYTSFSGLKGPELTEEMDANVADVVKKAEKLLLAEPMKPGVYDIVFGPRAAGMIAHEAFGHGIEMDMFVKGRAQGADYIGKPVANEKLSMYDGATSASHVSSYLFDDEGTFGTNTAVIKDGILKCGISDLLSALALGTTPTGNGKRESFEHKAYTRMTNTFFAGGTDKVEDMIKSIKYGFLIDDAESGMEDPKDWGIQVMFTSAEEIADGKLTGKIFSPVIMTGHVVELLKSVSMVSDEVLLEGAGYCGKGYKEYVKVSTGGAHIKAKARLG